ncbi:MAG: STAS domain-containing protein, partial [Armatimonadetes bacterium]|nr:STAS domain-containing protein [Candidatus Hippobium faecium]
GWVLIIGLIMIIETENDIIKFSGKLDRNLWPAAQTAVNMMLDEGRDAIIVDCHNLTEISADGLLTFADAFRYMNLRDVKLFFVGVDESVRKLAMATPGIRSSMPIAESVEDVRRSLAIEVQVTALHKDRYLLFPMVGNTSHAVMFADMFAKKGMEFDFVFPFIVPRKYNLYHPIKSLENKAESDLGRAEGFCVFNNRSAKKNIVRVRSHRSFFERLETKFPDAKVIISFAGCSMDRNENDVKFRSCLEQNLKGLIITEPFDKEKPYEVKKKFKKTAVYITGIKDYDEACVKLAEKLCGTGFVEFIKLNKLKWGKTPGKPFNKIEGFVPPERIDCLALTVPVNSRRERLREYAEENKTDVLIMPALEGETDFLLSFMTDPPCLLCIVSPTL